MENSKNNNKEEKDNLPEAEKGAGNELKNLEEALSNAQKEAEDNLAGWQRTKADFMNYKKDQERMHEDLRKYANEDIIKALLPTVDSFDLAVKHLPADLESSDWVKGIMCIKGMFENFLRENGVEEIKSLGEKFDPNLFEAVGEEESDAEEDTVVEEMQKGYRMKGKVIRPAKVKVAK